MSGGRPLGWLGRSGRMSDSSVHLGDQGVMCLVFRLSRADRAKVGRTGKAWSSLVWSIGQTEEHDQEKSKKALALAGIPFFLHHRLGLGGNMCLRFANRYL
jgi:hypothetical protein